jgi:hypothetical protein
MPTLLGSLRSAVLAPSLADVGFARRGFPGRASAGADSLEAVPQAVVVGFEWGIASPGTDDLERRLAMVGPELRGFAYEGATMALTIRDSVSGGRTRELLLGPGRPHVFLAYIGIGFAMARLPRGLWRQVLPDLSPIPYHPVMSWLAVDGYGFDRAYFATRRWVDEQRVPRPYPWAGCPGYFPRAFDQGVGRALWFIHGGVPEGVAAAVGRFARARRPDLWSGVGLAAAFAGGCAPGELAALARAAGPHRAEAALGAVFAAKARHTSGWVPDSVPYALRALAGLDVQEAVALADRTEVPADAPGPLPPYEQWRRRIHAALADGAEHQPTELRSSP